MPMRNSVSGAFPRTHRIDKLRFFALFIRAQTVLNCKSYVASRREKKGESRDERYILVEARRAEQPKTDEKLCISETECHPSDAVPLKSTLS